MGVDVLRIPRSDINQIVAVRPAREGNPGRRFTALDEMREFPRVYMRSDIALVHVPKAHCTTCTCGEFDQKAVYVNEDGRLVGDGVPYLSPEDLHWCREEASRLLVLAEDYPEVRKHYLKG